MQARATKWAESQARTRASRAARWRAARRRLAALTDNERAVLLAAWNRAPYPADPTYLLDFLHSYSVGRFALDSIPFDQVPRNIFRGTARAFAHDAEARRIARIVQERGWDLEGPVERRVFLYLPFEHSENLADQEFSVRLFRERANEDEYLKYAEAHLDVIRRYGRFPQRNAALGRDNTEAETAYLAQPGAGF